MTSTHAWAQSTAVIVVETPNDAGVPGVGEIQWKMVADLEDVKAIPVTTLADRGITDPTTYTAPTWNAETKLRFSQKLDVAKDRYFSRDLVEAHRLFRLLAAELEDTNWVPNAFVVSVYEWQVASLIAQNLPIKASVPARAVIALSPTHQVDLGVFNPEVADVIEQAKTGPTVSFGLATAPSATVVTLNGRRFTNKVREAKVTHRFVITRDSYEPVELLVRGDANHPSLKMQLPLRIKPVLRGSLVEALQRKKPLLAENALKEISRLTGAARVVIVGAKRGANGVYTTTGFSWTADADTQEIVSGPRSSVTAALRRQIKRMPVVVAPTPTPRPPARPEGWVVTSEAGAGAVFLFRSAVGEGGNVTGEDFHPEGVGVSVSALGQRGNLGIEGRFDYHSFDLTNIKVVDTSNPGGGTFQEFMLGSLLGASAGGVYSREPLSFHLGGFWRRHLRNTANDELDLGVEYEFIGAQSGVSFRIGGEDARFVTNVGALGRVGAWSELHGRNTVVADGGELGLGFSVYAGSTFQVGAGFEVSARAEFEYRSVRFDGEDAAPVEPLSTIRNVRFQEYSPSILLLLRRSFD